MKEKKLSRFLNSELWGMVISLFSAFCLFCLFTGASVFYPFGFTVQKFLLGTFGFFAYPLFLFLTVFGFMIIFGKKISSGKSKLTAVMLAVILCFAFFITHLATNPISGTFNEYISSAYYSAEKGVFSSTFGGAFFAMPVYGVATLISTVGAYALFSAIILVCALVILKDRIFAKADKLSDGDRTRDDLSRRDWDGRKDDRRDGRRDDREYGEREEPRRERDDYYRREPRYEKPLDSYSFGETRRDKKLIVGDSRFEMKTDEDYAHEKRESSVRFEDSKDTSTYSDEYSRGIGERSKYSKTAKKVTPENAGYKYGASVSNSGGEEELRGSYDDYEEPSSTDDIYIPKTYERAMRKEKTDDVDLSKYDSTTDFSKTDAGEYEEYDDYDDDVVVVEEDDYFDEDDIENSVSDESKYASDEKIVDMSKVKEDELKFNGVDDEIDEASIYDADEFEDDEPTKKEFKRPTPRKAETVKSFTQQRFDYAKYDKGEEKSSSASDDGDDEGENPIDNMPLNFKYNAPPVDLLENYLNNDDYGKVEYFKQEKGAKIINTLKVLGGIEVKIVNIVHGPTVTRFDLAIPDHVTVKNVLKYTEDLKLRLATTQEIRVAPIKGSSLIGVEVPNETKSMVGLREVVESGVFKNAKKNSLTFAIGKNLIGESVVADICKMPHLLIAGSTGTGKSVGLNALIVSLMMKYSPQELRFIIVDPKFVEFTVFEGIPHMLFNEIIVDAKKAVAMLDWACKEMDARYVKLRKEIVQNIDDYNAQINPKTTPKMYRIVIIIDEFADLMSTEKKAIEEKIARIAQKARAAGIYLILATQRPSVNIMEGSIKTNFTSRMAFKMSNATDSTTILGEAGAEKLLGAGDLFYKTSTMPNIERAQGAYIDMKEIKRIVSYIKEHNQSYFNESALKAISKEASPQIEGVNGKEGGGDMKGGVPPEYIEALRFAVEARQISISLIQRKLSFGFPKAAKVFDWMVAQGYVIESQGGKQKQVVLSPEEFEELYG